MGDYTEIGQAWVGLMRLMGWLLALSVPLALWKLVDIAVWAWQHVHVSFGG